jgi:hypothetical protein
MLSKPAKITLRIPKGNYMATWIETASGKTISTEKLNCHSTNTSIETALGNDDKVLKLTKIF